MFKLIWWGLAYTLIFIGVPDGSWLAVHLEKSKEQPDKSRNESSAKIGAMAAQNFGF